MGVLLVLCFSLFLLAFVVPKVNNKHRPLNAKKSMPFAHPKTDTPAIAIEMTNNPDFESKNSLQLLETRMSIVSQMGNDDYKNLLQLRSSEQLDFIDARSEKEMEGDVTTDAAGTIQREDSGLKSKKNATTATVMGKGILLKTRNDGTEMIQLSWKLANNSVAILYRPCQT